MQSLYKKTSSKIYYSVGSGGSGQLLLGDTNDYYNFKKIDFASLFLENKDHLQDFEEEKNMLVLGGTVGLSLTKKGEVYSWGESYEKQTLKVNIIPAKIMSNPIIIKRVSCGWSHNLCLTSNNELYAWGESKHGQLGMNINNSYCKDPTLISIKTDSMKIKDVYAGFRQSYIMLDNSNTILVSGSNKFLELGFKSDKNIVQSEEEKVFIQLSIGQRHVIAIDKQGNAYGWGSNKFGQLGFNNNSGENQYLPMKLELTNIKKISSGWSHNLFLTYDDKLFACGRGDFGQQGNGSRDHSFNFHEIEIPFKINSFYCNSESCYVLTTNKLYVWGWNEHGNLGTSDKEDRLSPELLNLNCIADNTEISTGGAALILISREELDDFNE